MSRRRVLVAAAVVLVTMGAVLAVVVAKEFAGRGCSLSDAERQDLLSSLNGAEALDAVFGPDPSLKDFVIEGPGERRDFALDQGPQRICASGATARATPSGEVNVLIRVYDSPAAARKNSSSNLPDAPVKLDSSVEAEVLVSNAVCSRLSGSECLEHSAQAIAGSVSVIVKSRETDEAMIIQSARDLAIQLGSATLNAR